MTEETTMPTRRSARQLKSKGEANAATSSTRAAAPPQAPPTGSAPAGKRRSKTEAVVALLQRPEGATMAELVEASGWLPHTTRAATTGLKMKGKVITKGKRGDVASYFIASAAA